MCLNENTPQVPAARTGRRYEINIHIFIRYSTRIIIIITIIVGVKKQPKKLHRRSVAIAPYVT